MLCLFLLFRKFESTLRNSYPSFSSQLSEIPLYQISVWLLCGFVQIALILLCILLKLNFLDVRHVACVVIAVAAVGALVYQRSPKYRCITNLMTVLFLGRSGRALLITLLLTMIISGVVHNIWANTFEIVRVFVCTTGIHIRLTRMKFELLTTPFLHQFEAAVSTRKHLQDEVERMTAFIQPAVEAVENPDPRFTPNNSTKETEPSDPDIVTCAEYVQRYREKLYTQCLFQIRETQRVCIQNYSHLYFECVERVSLIQSYCAVFKVENYCSISKIVSGSTPESFCDTTKVIPGQHMGDAYRRLIKNRKQIETARESGMISFNVTDLPSLPGIEEIKNTADDIKIHLMKKRKFIDVALLLLSSIDVLILVHLLYTTLSYYRLYVVDIDFDNIYLSDELWQMDQERTTAQSDQPSIWPLKHAERDFYVDPLRKQLRRREWFSISYNLLYIALIVLGVSGLFLLDWIYYTGLDVVRQNALVNFEQEGSFNFTLTVNGAGLLARIIRDATAGLNHTEFQSMNETNAKCLPSPTRTEWRYYTQVYAVALLLLYMNVNLMYSQRMMSVICGHFFPQKHRMRIKYLYSQMLIRRRIYFVEGVQNLLGQGVVSEAHKRTTTAGVVVVGKRETFLRRCFKGTGQRVMEKFGKTVVKSDVHCSVCLEKENAAVTGNFRSCGFDKCPLRYCDSCWHHLYQRCAVYYASHEEDEALNGRPQSF